MFRFSSPRPRITMGTRIISRASRTSDPSCYPGAPFSDLSAPGYGAYDQIESGQSTAARILGGRRPSQSPVAPRVTGRPRSASTGSRTSPANFRYVGKKKIGFIHWENSYSNSFQIEWDMIVVTVFLSILNQMEFPLVQNRKENCHHYRKLKGKLSPVQFERKWNTSFLSVVGSKLDI